MTIPRFHLAIPVDDLEAGRAFYGDLLGCPQGREDPGHWIDFDLRGHQLVLHKGEGAGVRLRNAVDGDAVPVPHFAGWCSIGTNGNRWPTGCATRGRSS